MVDYVREVTADKFCEYDDYGLFEHFGVGNSSHKAFI